MRGRSLHGPDAEKLVADVLRAGVPVSLVARGHSMTPAIRSGDRLTLEPLGAAPRVGDVLACEIDGRLVVHRCVRWRGGRVEVRGDAAAASDGPLAPDAVLGKVSRVERCGARVLLGRGRAGALLAWLSRHGLLRAAARWRERLRSVPPGGGIRLALPVSEGKETSFRA